MSICKPEVKNYLCKAFVKCNTTIKRPSFLPITMKQLYLIQNNKLGRMRKAHAFFFPFPPPCLVSV